jgi:hypothetical protein
MLGNTIRRNWKKYLVVVGVASIALLPKFVLADYQNILQITGNGSQAWGKGVTWESKIAEQVNPISSQNGYVCQIKTAMYRNGNPTDSVRLRIYSGGSLPDNGTLIATSAVLGSSFSTSSNPYQLITFDLDNCFYFQSGKNYYFVFDRTGDLDPDNYYYYWYYNGNLQNYYIKWGYLMGSWNNNQNIELDLTLNGWLELAPPTSTSTEQVITCDPNSGFFSYSFCYLFQYLFSPDQIALNNFYNLKDELKNKIPFSYFYQISDLVASTTIAATSSAIDINLKSQDFNFGTVSFMSFDNIQPFKNVMDKIFKTAIWVGLAFYFFWRIIHLEL